MTASIVRLSDIDVTELAGWISKIPFEAWPQQPRWLGQLRPAMVNDLSWQGFGAQTDELVSSLIARHFPGAAAYQRMLSIVMPGQGIAPHGDAQIPGWQTRVHVPILSGPRAWFIVDGEMHRLAVGSAYAVDVRRTHAVENWGETPRIHLMFDVR